MLRGRISDGVRTGRLGSNRGTSQVDRTASTQRGTTGHGGTCSAQIRNLGDVNEPRKCRGNSCLAALSNQPLVRGLWPWRRGIMGFNCSFRCRRPKARAMMCPRLPRGALSSWRIARGTSPGLDVWILQSRNQFIDGHPSKVWCPAVAQSPGPRTATTDRDESSARLSAQALVKSIFLNLGALLFPDGAEWGLQQTPHGHA